MFLPQNTPVNALSIPAEAVTFSLDPQVLDEEFLTVNGGDLIERINVIRYWDTASVFEVDPKYWTARAARICYGPPPLSLARTPDR